ncbi:hypothetical protein [Sphingomonas beigongshangi]|uniref:hypothetical protein n=1 Tax=Sphingomonas beigongshangi TaxID=2782540 RepID=UPI001AEF164F|nr:hypothetical protein [Sphingomonas beigongshangi]
MSRKAYVQEMAAFDDAYDPELAAACNRLAAWVEPLPEGMLIDPASRLTESDLALILRRLYATRHVNQDVPRPLDDDQPRQARPSVPLTAKD